jgi:hypothetical protein
MPGKRLEPSWLGWHVRNLESRKRTCSSMIIRQMGAAVREGREREVRRPALTSGGAAVRSRSSPRLVAIGEPLPGSTAGQGAGGGYSLGPVADDCRPRADAPGRHQAFPHVRVARRERLGGRGRRAPEQQDRPVDRVGERAAEDEVSRSVAPGGRRGSGRRPGRGAGVDPPGAGR